MKNTFGSQENFRFTLEKGFQNMSQAQKIMFQQQPRESKIMVAGKVVLISGVMFFLFVASMYIF